MRESLTQYDVPALRGWEYGISDSFMWKKDVSGTDWQMTIGDGEFVMFAYKMSAVGPMSPQQKLTHEQYKELFGT